jgi:hypothetical protein
VIATDAQRLVLALWVVHTHLVRQIEQTPYLSITSPDPECGKSRLLEVLDQLVARPWMVARPSEAVAYRKIDSLMPTLLLDEVDTIFHPKQAGQHEGLRAILDAGHRRGVTVDRSADFGRSFQQFSPYCAKALAGIGALPDTVAKRSIYIRLQRKRKDEEVEKFRRRDVEPPAAALRAQVAAWAKTNGKKIGDARPDMPEGLSDRMEDGCECLVAIADACGCGRAARDALVELLASGTRLDSHEAFKTRLLADLKDIWTERERPGRRELAMFTEDMLNALLKIDEGPWRKFYGHELDATDLAALLRPYGVSPTTVNVRGHRAKGYRRAALWDVFERYVTDESDATAGNEVTGGNGT